jgi:hypothetical protein
MLSWYRLETDNRLSPETGAAVQSLPLVSRLILQFKVLYPSGIGLVNDCLGDRSDMPEVCLKPALGLAGFGCPTSLVITVKSLAGIKVSLAA